MKNINRQQIALVKKQEANGLLIHKNTSTV